MKLAHCLWACVGSDNIYILLSIKTRIETSGWSISQNADSDIYILLSIKTRIETCLNSRENLFANAFISYYPLKQGLKRRNWKNAWYDNSIYILLSIKTRIETANGNMAIIVCPKFISYYPLKQGLKLAIFLKLPSLNIEFISYYPLKQGLKLQNTWII